MNNPDYIDFDELISNIRGKTKTEPDHYDMLDDEFDNVWMDICEYANLIGVSPRYVEEEFYILGELIKLGDKSN